MPQPAPLMSRALGTFEAISAAARICGSSVRRIPDDDIDCCNVTVHSNNLNARVAISRRLHAEAISRQDLSAVDCLVGNHERRRTAKLILMGK